MYKKWRLFLDLSKDLQYDEFYSYNVALGFYLYFRSQGQSPLILCRQTNEHEPLINEIRMKGNEL